MVIRCEAIHCALVDRDAMVPNAGVRIGAIPIVVILNAAADPTSEVAPNVEVRNAAPPNAVTQSASGDFLNEVVLIGVQDVVLGAVLQSVVTQSAVIQCAQSAVTRCAQVVVIQCVVTLAAMVVLQNDSLTVPRFGVQGVVQAGRDRLAPDAVQSAADAPVPDESQFLAPAPELARLQVAQRLAVESCLRQERCAVSVHSRPDYACCHRRPPD